MNAVNDGKSRVPLNLIPSLSPVLKNFKLNKQINKKPFKNYYNQ